MCVHFFRAMRQRVLTCAPSVRLSVCVSLCVSLCVSVCLFLCASLQRRHLRQHEGLTLVEIPYWEWSTLEQGPISSRVAYLRNKLCDARRSV